MKFQLNYLNDRITSESLTQTTYFLEDSLSVIDESESMKAYKDQLNSTIVLTANTPTFYLKNSLKADLNWNNTDIKTLGSLENYQTGSLPYNNISNDFQLTKKINKRLVSISSYNSFQTKPQDLTVRKIDNLQNQQINSSAFFSNSSILFGLNFKSMIVSLKSGLTVAEHELKSNLTGINDNPYLNNNNTLFGYSRLYTVPIVEHNSSWLKGKIEIPLSYYHYWFCDKLTDERNPSDNFTINPKLALTFIITPRLSCIMYGSIEKRVINGNDFYSGLIMQNYRYLSKGLVNYSNNTVRSISNGIFFKNPLNMFFANRFSGTF